MPINESTLPRRVMTLFILADSSGSMSVDGNMGKVNGAIEEMIPLLQDVSDENSDAEIRVAVLEFSSGCKWATDGVVSLDDFYWQDMTAGGLTDMGAAFTELESKLSRKEYMNNASGNYAPVIILLSDGAPTDDYMSGLQLLRHNNWFRCAMKIAIAVENSATDVLAEFTGSNETVIRYDSEHSDLKKLLTRLAVVSSTMQSRSQSVVHDDPPAPVPGPGPDPDPFGSIWKDWSPENDPTIDQTKQIITQVTDDENEEEPSGQNEPIWEAWGC